jgi:hypothetical protein
MTKKVGKAKSNPLSAKIMARKRYIMSVLRKADKYTPDLAQQVDIAARLYVRLKVFEAQMAAPDYEVLIRELSREGNERISVNPLEATYRTYLEQYQSALRALGMNVDSKDRKKQSDGFSNFMNNFTKDD